MERKMKQFRTPVKGEIVLFRRIAGTVPERSFRDIPAIITEVHGEGVVSLVVFDAFEENGQVARPELNVECGLGDRQWHGRKSG